MNRRAAEDFVSALACNVLVVVCASGSVRLATRAACVRFVGEYSGIRLDIYPFDICVSHTILTNVLSFNLLCVADVCLLGVSTYRVPSTAPDGGAAPFRRHAGMTVNRD